MKGQTQHVEILRDKHSINSYFTLRGGGGSGYQVQYRKLQYFFLEIWSDKNKKNHSIKNTKS